MTTLFKHPLPIACEHPASQASSGQSWKPGIVAERTEVVAHHKMNAEYRHLRLSCSSQLARAAPGQFFQLLCPHAPGDQPFLRRPMSLYWADPGKQEIDFMYKVTGAGTRGLATLKAGDFLDIMGPLGVGFTLDPRWKHIAAVGRGAGLATLAPLAKAARANGTHVTAIMSARRPDLLVSSDLFDAQGATVIGVTDLDQTSDPAHVERLLRGLIHNQQCDALFTCGSSRLLRVLQRLANEFGLPGQVAMEQQMACGLGMCFCCVRNFDVNGTVVSRRVCSEGPVFDLMEAMP